MTTRSKIRLGCLTTVIVFVAMAIEGFLYLKGFDASKEDPRKLYMFYVQKQIPTNVIVESAVGHSNFGGTFIKFRLKVSGTAVDDLIKAKRLHVSDFPDTHLLRTNELAELKRPEFYWTNKDTTWSKIGRIVQMVTDRDRGLVYYIVFSP